MITEYTEVISPRRLRAAGPLDWKYVVADLSARDVIPAEERYEGMQVFVEGDTVYILQGGITNGDWVNVTTGELAAINVTFDNTSTSIVTATEVQTAIEQLDASIVGGITYLGTFDPNNPPTPAPTDGDTVNFNPGDLYVVDTAGFWNFTTGDQTPDGGGDNVANLVVGDRLFANPSIIWEVVGNVDQVSSVFGRTGNVIAAAGDYDAVQVDYDNVASGLTATNVQDAIDEVRLNAAAAGTLTGAIQLRGGTGIFDADDQFYWDSTAKSLVGLFDAPSFSAAPGRSIVFGETNTIVGAGSGSVFWTLFGGSVNTFDNAGTFRSLGDFIVGGTGNTARIANGSFGIFSGILWGEGNLIEPGQSGVYTYSNVGGGNNISRNSYQHLSGFFADLSALGAFSHAEGETTNKITVDGRFAGVLASKNTVAQTLGHGANAENSFILAAQDANIPSDSPRSVVITGNLVKARAATPDTAYLANLIIGEGGTGTVFVSPKVDGSVVTAGEAGQFRWNTNQSRFEGHDGANWSEIGAETLPGGNDTELQFNDGGVFGGDNHLLWDKVNDQLTIQGSTDNTTFPSFRALNNSGALMFQITNNYSVGVGPVDTSGPGLTNRILMSTSSSPAAGTSIILHEPDVTVATNVSQKVALFANPEGGSMVLRDTAGNGLIQLSLNPAQDTWFASGKSVGFGNFSPDPETVADFGSNASSAIRVPRGDTGDRDTLITSPKPGMFRFNNDDDSFEGYTTAKGWGAIGGAGEFEVFTATHTGGDLNIDLDQGNFQVWTLQADVDSLILANVTNKDFVVVFIQDSVGGHNILAWNGVKTVDAATPDLSLDPNAESFFNFINANGSTYVFGAGKLGAIA